MPPFRPHRLRAHRTQCRGLADRLRTAVAPAARGLHIRSGCGVVVHVLWLYPGARLV